MPDLELHVETIFEESVDAFSVLALSLSELALVGVLVLRILTVADLIVLKDALHLD